MEVSGQWYSDTQDTTHGQDGKFQDSGTKWSELCPQRARGGAGLHQGGGTETGARSFCISAFSAWNVFPLTHHMILFYILQFSDHVILPQKRRPPSFIYSQNPRLSCFHCHFFFFFLLHPWHSEVPGTGTEPAPQQRPKLLRGNAGSLPFWATRELPRWHFFNS